MASVGPLCNVIVAITSKALMWRRSTPGSDCHLNTRALLYLIYILYNQPDTKQIVYMPIIDIVTSGHNLVNAVCGHSIQTADNTARDQTYTGIENSSTGRVDVRHLMVAFIFS